MTDAQMRELGTVENLEKRLQRVRVLPQDPEGWFTRCAIITLLDTIIEVDEQAEFNHLMRDNF
jgi:hypothetical protein